MSKIKQYLMAQMDEAEKLKALLPEGSTKADHKASLTNFVTGYFTKVDKDERTCETITKQNAISFQRASHFIDILQQFDKLEWDLEWADKRKYCLFKAGMIMKALKAG